MLGPSASASGAESLTMARNTFESREINVTIPKYSENSCQNSQHLNGALQLLSRLNHPG